MACLPNPSKCEWAELKHFVAWFNRHRLNDFRHACCLDRQPGSKKAPEVLCRNSAGDSMVVERKILPWPVDYVKRHRAEHFFSEAISEGLRPLCADAPYELCVAPLETFSPRMLSRLAKNLSAEITLGAHSLRDGEQLSIASPFRCFFRKQFPEERDFCDPSIGLCVVWPIPHPEDLANPKGLPTEFVEKVKTYYGECVLKFAAFPNSLRILVLNFVQPELYGQCDSRWWKEFFEIHSPSTSLDQIWGSCESEGSWEFRQLYERTHSLVRTAEAR